MQDRNYCLFKIYDHVIEWNGERILWIGFYKNKHNSQCAIDTLPKEIITRILSYFQKINDETAYIRI